MQADALKMLCYHSGYGAGLQSQLILFVAVDYIKRMSLINMKMREPILKSVLAFSEFKKKHYFKHLYQGKLLWEI